MEQQFGDIIITFTSNFKLIYNNKNTSASKNGSFWQPIPPSGFTALGSLGINSNDDVNGLNWSMCVKAADNPSKPKPLASPVSFEKIWSSDGAGGTSASCWRPVPPSGYVSMGDVFVQGNNTPYASSVACVREDYTILGALGNEIWNDSGTGLKNNIDIYSINSPQNINIQSQVGYFTANTFAANNKYSPITGSCLALPLVSTVTQVSPPTLTGVKYPNLDTAVIDRKLCVPFTAILDSDRTIDWKVKNSPFYYVQRMAQYQLVLFDFNQQNSEQHTTYTVSTGINSDQCKAFGDKTGINMSVDSGIKSINPAAAVSYSYKMGWGNISTLRLLQQNTQDLVLTIPPNTAAAAWVLNYTLCIARQSGECLPQEINFNVNAHSQCQYNSKT